MTRCTVLLYSAHVNNEVYSAYGQRIPAWRNISLKEQHLHPEEKASPGQHG